MKEKRLLIEIVFCSLLAFFTFFQIAAFASDDMRSLTKERLEISIRETMLFRFGAYIDLSTKSYKVELSDEEKNRRLNFLNEVLFAIKYPRDFSKKYVSVDIFKEDSYSSDSMIIVGGHDSEDHIVGLLSMKPEAEPVSHNKRPPDVLDRIRNEIKPSQSKAEFCQMASSFKNFQSVIAKAATYFNPSHLSDGRLAFANPRGYWDIGLCWWHSQFQRSGIYLTLGRPLKEGEAPIDQVEARKLTLEIIQKHRVVELRGFKGLRDFTTQFTDVVTDELSKWQVRDTAMFAWMRNFLASDMPPEDLRKVMDDAYWAVEKEGKIVYQLEKFPNVINMHAHLIIGMNKIYDQFGLEKGYRIYFVDSYAPLYTLVATYEYGTRNIVNFQDGRDVLPFTEHDGDFNDYKESILAYCRPDIFKQRLEKVLQQKFGLGKKPHPADDWSSRKQYEKIINKFDETGIYPNDMKILNSNDYPTDNWERLMNWK